MSWKIAGACWDLDLPANKMLVLLAMADHADHNGNNVFPSIGLVAYKTGYSERQVMRIVKALTKDGILIERNREAGKVTRFSINTSAGKQKLPYTKGQNVTPDNLSGHPGQNVTPTPDIAMSDEPSLEPINKPSVSDDTGASSKQKTKDKKPTPFKERDPLFDAVAQHVWNTDPAQITAAGGRIGAITAWLSGKSDGMKRGKERLVVGTISAPAKPEHVAAFMKWFAVAHPGITLRDFEKFVEYWREWASAVNASRSPRPAPVAPEETEAERADRLARLHAARRAMRQGVQS